MHRFHVSQPPLYPAAGSINNEELGSFHSVLCIMPVSEITRSSKNDFFPFQTCVQVPTGVDKLMKSQNGETLRLLNAGMGVGGMTQSTGGTHSLQYFYQF